MELLLSLCACTAFILLPSAAPLVLRCGLSACMRFSPRASAALSGCAALGACLTALPIRGKPRHISASMRLSLTVPSIIGAVTGRAALLMFTARFPGSLSLLRLQAAPLLIIVLMFVLCAIKPRFFLPASLPAFSLFVLLCSMTDGFFGAGGMALFAAADQRGIRRKPYAPATDAYILGLTAQLSALLFTLLCSAQQSFPAEMMIALLAGSSFGILLFEQTKKRSVLQAGMRAAMLIYMVLAALAGIEQAYASGFIMGE